MFDIKIDNANYWKDCTNAIVSLVIEGAFSISKEGISLKAMDPSGISMVSFSMPSKAFSKFEIDKDSDVGLNLENLSKIMSRTRDDEALHIKATENKLSMEFVGKGGKRRYRLPMVDVRKNADKEPNVAFDAVIELSGDPLKEIIKDASQVSSYISFKASKEQLTISAFGDSADLEELHEAGGHMVKKIEASKNAEAVFNLEYLENMVKACPAGGTLKICLKSNEPLKMSYNIKDASITYFLAPYVGE